MVYLTRRYRFSAAHRLHNPGLGDAENARVYGKCNNPHGHGHNYVLEVMVAGMVSGLTGMVIDLGVLDGIVQREILDRFDHAYLNADLAFSGSFVPTTENLCVLIFRNLQQQLMQLAASGSVDLRRVRIEETSSNFFEYCGEHAFTERETPLL